MSRTAYHHHHHRQPEYHRVGGASTILPSDQPPPRQFSLSILPSRSLALIPLCLFCTARYPLRSSRKTRQAGRVPLAFARSGLLIRPRRCASRARAVSTLPLKSTTRMPRETKAWGFPPRVESGTLPDECCWCCGFRITNCRHEHLPVTKLSPRGRQNTLPCRSYFLNNASPTIRDLSKM